MDWRHWGARLKLHMKERGISQEAVAEKMDMTQGGFSHWVNGRREVNLGDFFRVCEIVRADPRDILFGETDTSMVLSDLQRLLSENPALRGMVARPRAPDELVARAIPPAPSKVPKRLAHRRRPKT